jgi:septal ring factor EnvC (AmiA/AmiB activator)
MVVNDSFSWFFDIFSWEHLSYVLTVFAILTASVFVPLWQMFKKRKAEQQKEQEEKQTSRIREIAHEIQKPIIDKLTAQEIVQAELKYSQKENDRNTRDILSAVKNLTGEFQQYRDQQHKLNAKIYFIDGWLKNRMTDDNTVPSRYNSYKNYRYVNDPDNESDNGEDNNNKLR